MSRCVEHAMVTMLVLASLSGLTASAENKASVAPATAHANLDSLRRYLNEKSDIEFVTTFEAAYAASDDNVRGKAQVIFRRPNLFRVEAVAANDSYVFVSDGAVLTIYDARKKQYAEVTARATLSDNMNLVSGLMGYEARIFDFLAALDRSATVGSDVQITSKGPETIQGQETQLFDVKATSGNWQVWVASSGTPLPVRLATASIDDPSKTAQTNHFEWKTDPVFPPTAFVFSPPEGSRKAALDELELAPPE
jgi:hypothetical protein